MLHYDYYADVPEAAVQELVRSSRLARLVTVGDDGMPHLGLFPFAHDDAGFELHLHRSDEQIADLRRRPRCVLEVDEVLGTIPSHWIDPDNAVFATAYHKTAVFECAATLHDDPDAIAAQQARLMQRYQPEARHRPLRADDPMYTGMLRLLVGARLEITNARVKFKLGQNRSLETRADLVERLRARGAEVDRRTADALAWTVDLGWTTRGRAS